MVEFMADANNRFHQWGADLEHLGACIPVLLEVEAAMDQCGPRETEADVPPDDEGEGE